MGYLCGSFSGDPQLDVLRLGSVMETTTFKCDSAGCEKMHTGNNGWYLLQRRGRYFVVGTWVEQQDLREYEHYCGISCLFKRISELTGKEI